MNSLQKVIKYLAISFALFLIFNIFYSFTYLASFLGNLYDNGNQSITEKLNDLEIDDNSLLLDISVLTSNVTIKKGTDFKAETNNKYINAKQEDNKLYIMERKHNLFNVDNSELIVYVPDNFIFDGVSIDTGAGKANIDSLVTKRLYLNLGAGKVEINDLEVSENAKIDGGAGQISINAISINDLDLNMGIGKLSLVSKLTGKSKIDSGVGEMNLSLIGTLEDYKIFLDKGIGNATIDGNNMKDNDTYGTGIDIINIDGGIGDIDINFIEE